MGQITAYNVTGITTNDKSTENYHPNQHFPSSLLSFLAFYLIVLGFPTTSVGSKQKLLKTAGYLQSKQS